MRILWFTGVQLPAVTGEDLNRAGWQEGLGGLFIILIRKLNWQLPPLVLTPINHLPLRMQGTITSTGSHLLISDGTD